MFEQFMEERPVRIPAGMPHDEDLVGLGLDKVQHCSIVPGFEVSHGLDVLEKFVVLQVLNVAIIVVQFISISENNGIVRIVQLSVNMDYFTIFVGI